MRSFILPKDSLYVIEGDTFAALYLSRKNITFTCRDEKCFLPNSYDLSGDSIDDYKSFDGLKSEWGEFDLSIEIRLMSAWPFHFKSDNIVYQELKQ